MMFHTKYQSGSMEGRMLVLFGAALIVSVALMAWFSEAPTAPDEGVPSPILVAPDTP